MSGELLNRQRTILQRDFADDAVKIEAGAIDKSLLSFALRQRESFHYQSLVPVCGERVAGHPFDNHELLRLMGHAVLKQPREIRLEFAQHITDDSHFIGEPMHGVGKSFDVLRTCCSRCRCSRGFLHVRIEECRTRKRAVKFREGVIDGRGKIRHVDNMSAIPPVLRRRIDSAACELSTIAEHLRKHSPALADVYRALGQGLDASHYKFQGGHCLFFDLPRGCRLSVDGQEVHEQDGPVKLSLRVTDAPKT